MPRAIERMATSVRPGDRVRSRKPYEMSWKRVVMQCLTTIAANLMPSATDGLPANYSFPCPFLGFLCAIPARPSCLLASPLPHPPCRLRDIPQRHLERPPRRRDIHPHPTLAAPSVIRSRINLHLGFLHQPVL